MTKRILVLGGDGYLGWPCAHYFARRGHTIAIIDNEARRGYDAELGTNSLLPIPTTSARQALCPPNVFMVKIDVAGEYDRLARFIADFRPDAIIHFAEQRAAPYSMIDREHCLYTHTNNVNGTLNVLHAMRDHCPGAHLIKLGTMGEYGCPNIDIEEGFIEIEHRGRSDVLPFPKQPGSWYHLTKVHDSNNIMFACKIWGLRATDLNQGVVYGAETDECPADSPLCTRLDYDGVFGTVLNRFCVQAACRMPLTVYGKGGQTRGYLDIRDTMRCIELAMENPPGKVQESKSQRVQEQDNSAPSALRPCNPAPPDNDDTLLIQDPQADRHSRESGNPRSTRSPGSPIPTFAVFNQITEVFSVNDLARMVRQAGEAMGLEVQVDHTPNPRIEPERHYYQPAMDRFKVLGLQHRKLSAAIPRLIELALRHKGRIRRDRIPPAVKWRS